MDNECKTVICERKKLRNWFVLIADLSLDLGLGLDIAMGVGMDADSIVNKFSSCCL